MKEELKLKGFDNPTNSDALIWGMWKDLSKELADMHKDLSNKLSYLIGASAIAFSVIIGLLIVIVMAVL